MLEKVLISDQDLERLGWAAAWIVQWRECSGLWIGRERCGGVWRYGIVEGTCVLVWGYDVVAVCSRLVELLIGDVGLQGSAEEVEPRTVVYAPGGEVGLWQGAG